VSALTIGLASLVGLFGGALLPLPAYRLSVPADEPTRSACIACGTTLPGGRQGWIGFLTRCSACGARLGSPAWLTAIVAAVACGLIAATVGPVPVLPMFVAVGLLGVLLGAVDLDCKRLPHALVVPAIRVSGALFAVVSALTGEWGALLRAALGAVILGAAFLLLYLLPGRGLGYGDVKLAVLLGLFLGWLGWREVLLGGLLPWLVNAPIVIALLLSARVSRKTSLPFGPAMLVGALLAVLVGAWFAWSVGADGRSGPM